jgi:hypothetical protein
MKELQLTSRPMKQTTAGNKTGDEQHSTAENLIVGTKSRTGR